MEAFIAGLDRDDREHYRILVSYFPCPRELETTVSGWSNDEAVQAEREKQYEANKAKYGHKDWYDWQYDKWGTKWGDCETTLVNPPYDDLFDFVSADFFFQTAWGPATDGFIEVSRRFPEILFHFWYDEEAGFFRGGELILAGEHRGDAKFEPCNYHDWENCDWDNDHWTQAYESWMEQNSERVHEQLREMRDHLLKSMRGDTHE